MDAPEVATAAPGANGRPTKVISEPASVELLERLRGELAAQQDGDRLLAWAKVGLPLKNILLEVDARTVDAAYRSA
ncbi:hypothetical protein FXV83_35015 [Bradyrhizobium hipponense]|uniref:Uncharacterized protein n=1 Tax=Bradyrhizobium hipponense TaxID=2605638 RepID=A0A5S4YEY8_9BRAD|nr:hypothetical protein [Bradyrhizobium hipponense]TYO62047.1 hypothetical protein FXV83_35015 [Bradyrhizobium hipponense]